MNTVIKTSIVAATAIFFSACGSSSDGSSTSLPETTAPYSGVFVDSAVSNVSWACGTESGVTTESGAFGVCPADSEVSFALGNITLGSYTPTAEYDMIFTPRDLAGVARDGSSTDEAANALANRIASLLMSMDSDGDPTNGINITDEAVEALESVVSEATDIAETTQAEVDTVITDTITEVTNSDAAAGAEMNQVTAGDAAEHQDDTAEAIVSGEVEPPVQPDPEVSLAWSDYTDFYFYFPEEEWDDAAGLESEMLFSGSVSIDHSAHTSTWTEERYDPSTGEWEPFDWDDYYLRDGEWMADNGSTAEPFEVSTDGLIAMTPWDDMKIVSATSLAGQTRTLGDDGSIEVTFSEGDIKYAFTSRSNDVYEIWDVLTPWDSDVTYSSIAAVMHERPMGWYYDESTSQHEGLHFKRDLSAFACGQENYMDAPIIGLVDELDSAEEGVLVIYDDSTCVQTDVGTWSGTLLPGQSVVSLIGEPTAGAEEYFSDDDHDSGLPLYAIKDGAVWEGEFSQASETFVQMPYDELIMNKSASDKVRAAIEAHEFPSEDLTTESL